MKKTAILFGSSGGTTQNVANSIAKIIEGEIQVFDVARVSLSDIEDYQNLILGTST
jgi:flavodoxin